MIELAVEGHYLMSFVAEKHWGFWRVRDDIINR